MGSRGYGDIQPDSRIWVHARWTRKTFILATWLYKSGAAVVLVLAQEGIDCSITLCAASRLESSRGGMRRSREGCIHGVMGWSIAWLSLLSTGRGGEPGEEAREQVSP